jgi:glycosyltransferase involved in cell wall biosynthesis
LFYRSDISVASNCWEIAENDAGGTVSRQGGVMTTAIVHDFLTQRGGAERVVLHIASQVEDPVIVTSTYAPNATYPEFRALPVWADQIVSNAEAERFRRRAFSYGKQFREKDLSFADEVIISTSTFAHHVRSEDALVYWYTPPRFLYDPAAYFSQRSVAKAFQVGTTPFRRTDRKAAVAHRKHLAVSARTARRLYDAYGLESEVVYPPFDPGRFAGAVDAHSGPPSALVVSRLLPYKRVDIAIRACAMAGVPLTIIGRGPDEDRLRALAPDIVTFAGHVTDEELIDAYDKHAMVLVPGIEDFGYIPLEAASRGRPVVASLEGGPAETVQDGTTGFLVGGSDPTAWADAILQTCETDWSIAAMRRSVEPFDARHFDDGIRRGLRSADSGSVGRGHLGLAEAS